VPGKETLDKVSTKWRKLEPSSRPTMASPRGPRAFVLRTV
jgi:hypothetical protein